MHIMYYALFAVPENAFRITRHVSALGAITGVLGWPLLLAIEPVRTMVTAETIAVHRKSLRTADHITLR